MILESFRVKSELDLEDLRKLVRNRVIPNANQNRDNEHFPAELFQELFRMGIIQAGAPLPEATFSTVALAEIARELAYGSVGVMISTMINYMCQTMLSQFASPDFQKMIFEKTTQKYCLWSFCMTEQDAGTDVSRIVTTATPCEGGYSISGKKCFITNANFSDHLIVFAQLEGKGVSVFYVPGNLPGITRGKPFHKLGERDSNTGEIFLEDVRIPRYFLIGTAGEGKKMLRRTIQRSKTLLAAAGVGISHRAYDLAVEFLATRHHYGSSLLSIQTIQNLLASLVTRMEASWLLTCRAAETWDADPNAEKEASMAKFFSTDAAVEFVSEVTELFGGYGCMKEYEIERLYRDVRALEIVEGASLVQQLLISKELFSKKTAHQSSSGARKAA